MVPGTSCMLARDPHSPLHVLFYGGIWGSHLLLAVVFSKLRVAAAQVLLTTAHLSLLVHGHTPVWAPPGSSKPARHEILRHKPEGNSEPIIDTITAD